MTSETRLKEARKALYVAIACVEVRDQNLLSRTLKRLRKLLEGNSHGC
jgi:DNA/RNA-binding domain of Phe-tRNA-synthetase-like protein